ncbi:MAG: hypothetical protein HGA45_14625 [Chloroflexales bacterium]|nr:hypothetical protein [Chloroflexales bacterium]
MPRPRLLLTLLILPLALAACADSAETPTPRPAATRPTAAPTSADDTWLIMLYEDADDQVLEQDMVTDLNEAERVGSSDQVTIVAQIDRYKGAFRGDGNWTLGWAYTGFLGGLVDSPTMDGRDLSQAIVRSYIEQDQRIVDDAARAEFVAETFDTTKARSARAVADDMSHDITLSAYDTAALPDLLAALDSFSLALSKLNKKTVASARTYAQRFENTFGDGPSPYIDLGSFAALIRKKTDSAPATAAADDLLAAIERAVIAEKHGDERSGASELTVADLELSAEEINQADSVTVGVSVDGEQVGFIYFFTGFYNPEDDSILYEAYASVTVNE